MAGHEGGSIDALLATDPFEATFQSARVGLAIVDLEGRFVRVNTAYAALVGAAPEDLIGTAFTVEPEQLQALLSGGGTGGGDAGDQPETGQFERELHEDLWVLQGVTLFRGPDGKPAWYVVDTQDISDRRRAERELAHRALHDQLTGLPNRVLALDRLRLALARAHRQGSSLGVLFLDLDGFKAVNDRHGHLLGDVVLQVVGARPSSVVRPSDTVARLGGDEFLVIVDPPVTAQMLTELEERLRSAVEAPLRERGRDTRVGLSVGGVVSRGERDPELLVARADEAMYAVKRERREGPRARELRGA